MNAPDMSNRKYIEISPFAVGFILHLTLIVGLMFYIGILHDTIDTITEQMYITRGGD